MLQILRQRQRQQLKATRIAPSAPCSFALPDAILWKVFVRWWVFFPPNKCLAQIPLPSPFAEGLQLVWYLGLQELYTTQEQLQDRRAAAEEEAKKRDRLERQLKQNKSVSLVIYACTHCSKAKLDLFRS